MNKKTKPPAHWDKQAEFWAQEVRSGKDIFRDLFNNPEFFKFIGSVKGKKVLDAGCGEGYTTRIIAKQGAQVTGIDIAENMIRLAKEEEQKNPLDIEYHIASFTDLSDFGDKSFDMVISFMALMDGPGYEKAVKEFYRVLKNNGELFFNIIHPCFFTPDYKRLEDDSGMIVRNYFKEKPWEFSFGLTKQEDTSDTQFAAISYHRTLSTYINNVIDAGFMLKKIGEPLPSEQAIKQAPRLKKALAVASFLYIHAIKKVSDE